MLPRLVASALAVSLSCVRVEPYLCEVDAECLSADGGRCEPDGRCSYFDPSCTGSQQRYGALAGDRARQCVDPTDQSTTTTASSTSSSTTADADATSSSESSAAPIPEHGEVEWFFVHAGDAAQDDAFWAVEALGEVDFVVAGYENTKAGGENILLVRYTDGDNEVWLDSRDEPGNVSAFGMVRGSDNRLYAGGQHSEGGDNRGWIGRWEVDGTRGWFTAIDFGWVVQDVAFAQGPLVGMIGNVTTARAYVAAHRSYDAPVWDHELSGAAARLQAVVGRGSEILVGGHLDNQAYIGRAEAAGITELARFSSGAKTVSAVQHLFTTEAGIFAAGHMSTLESNQGWVARLDPNGEKVWDRKRGAAADDEELESLVVADDGTIYAVGFAGSTDGNDMWLTAWSADGDFLWEQKYPERDEGNAIARDVTLTPGGDLLVVGEAEGAAGDLDAFAALIHP